MRLWHKDLIPVLPRQQLTGQWRELALIARDILNDGKTNHILVNKIMDYPLEHFSTYASLIYSEMQNRNYKVKDEVRDRIYSVGNNHRTVLYDDLFDSWHTFGYLRQCYYNLEEKYDCDGISEEEWKQIKNKITCEVFD